MPDIKKYKYYKEPKDLYSNTGGLREMTTEERMFARQKAKDVEKFIKEIFPEIDFEATTLRATEPLVK